MVLKEHTLILLPTNTENVSVGQIVKSDRYELDITLSAYVIREYNKFEWKPQHLYLLSNQNIQRNDWFYEKRNIPCIQKLTGGQLIYNTSKKIIATTDKQLELTLISDSFVKEYCKFYDSDDIEKSVVEVEYDEFFNMPKINTDNTINLKIKEVKETYTREEVIELTSRLISSRESRNLSDWNSIVDWVTKNI